MPTEDTPQEEAATADAERPDLTAFDPPAAEGSVETSERYARPGSDRLSEELLDGLRRGSTGASAAAFFDLDKTIIARSSTLMMGRSLIRDGLISPTVVLKSIYAQTVYQLVGADHERMEQMRQAILHLTKGWEVERVRRVVRETIEEVIAPYVYAEALELIEGHRAVGRDVWIVSSSGEEIVAPFAEYLGVRDYIATQGGIDDQGRYDGTLSFYAYAANKATAIRQVAEVRGYDLNRSYVYSDSITDLPFLNAVGNPVAVNPDRELRAAATAMAWEIRDFHSPVSLRRHLPELQRPRNDVLIGGVTLLAVAVVLWRWVLREDDE